MTKLFRVDRAQIILIACSLVVACLISGCGSSESASPGKPSNHLKKIQEYNAKAESTKQ